MSSKSPGRFFVIAGPTASGKSALAAAVAERCGGEIVGADAFQIYAGLPILTAQPGAEDLARAPHHLIGEIPLSEPFDLGQYQTMASRRIDAIRARGRPVIVCGGTGLYIRTLCRGLAPIPSGDAALRTELAAQPLETLQRRLTAADPEGAARVDLKNPRRVARALEVFLVSGRSLFSFHQEWAAAESRGQGIFLAPPRLELYARIDRRAAGLFERGVAAEVSAAGAVSRSAEQAIGLREVRACLAGTLAQEDAIAEIQKATRRYAKRQFTWFRQEPELTPMAPPGDAAAWAACVEQLAAQVAAM